MSKDRITISASGTAAQVEKAFGTTLKNYKLHGHTVRMAASDHVRPGLAQRQRGGRPGHQPEHRHARRRSGSAASTRTSAAATNPFPPAPAAFITAPPCGSSYSAKIATVTPPFGHGYPSKVPYQVCGYKPGQLRSAYNIGSATSGKGVTVAVVDAYGSATIASDSARYFKMNDPGNPFANAHFSQLNSTPFTDEAECDASSWLDEQAIDVQSVHSMAPNAHILYVGAQNCIDGLFDSEQNVIDNGLANVVTNSWGDDAGDLLDDVATRTAFDDLFMLADTTGMSVLFSSGDNGDNFNLFGLSSADYPPSSPFVTAVGGTSLKVGASGQQSGPARLGHRTFLQVHGQRRGRHARLHQVRGGHLAAGDVRRRQRRVHQLRLHPAVVPGGRRAPGAGAAQRGSVRRRPAAGGARHLDGRRSFDRLPHRAARDVPERNGPVRPDPVRRDQPCLADSGRRASPTLTRPRGVAVGFINPAIYKLDSTPGAIDDILPGGKQAQIRVDHAFTYVPGAKGFVQSFRELTYEGVITYCDATGNCATRPNTLTTATGYDSMTGLGSTGPNFVSDLAGS